MATLSWRGHSIDKENFYKLISLGDYLKCPNQWTREVNDPKLRAWLSENPLWFEEAKRELDWCLQNNIRWSVLGGADYPESLAVQDRPPLILSYFGSPCWLKHSLLAVVGSRRPSPEALMWMEHEIPRLLDISEDLGVVSGGAMGVDQKAHSLSIRKKRPTLVFLPSGLSNIYPAALKNWVPSVIETDGAMISPFSPFSPMFKGHFHYRNRLIAALSCLVFVVQARRRSGTMITARSAFECDREIATLPFFPGQGGSQGNLDLIFDGAHIVRDHKDLAMILSCGSAVGPNADS